MGFIQVRTSAEGVFDQCILEGSKRVPAIHTCSLSACCVCRNSNTLIFTEWVLLCRHCGRLFFVFLLVFWLGFFFFMCDMVSRRWTSCRQFLRTS